MMSQSLFTGMVALFWVSEFIFGGLILYWFVTQGLASGEKTDLNTVAPLETRATTMRSLALWAGFFTLLILGIIVGA